MCGSLFCFSLVIPRSSTPPVKITATFVFAKKFSTSVNINIESPIDLSELIDSVDNSTITENDYGLMKSKLKEIVDE